jgi:hypothetical protein
VNTTWTPRAWRTSTSAHSQHKRKVQTDIKHHKTLDLDTLTWYNRPIDSEIALSVNKPNQVIRRITNKGNEDDKLNDGHRGLSGKSVWFWLFTEGAIEYWAASNPVPSSFTTLVLVFAALIAYRWGVSSLIYFIASILNKKVVSNHSIIEFRLLDFQDGICT